MRCCCNTWLLTMTSLPPKKVNCRLVKCQTDNKEKQCAAPHCVLLHVLALQLGECLYVFICKAAQSALKSCLTLVLYNTLTLASPVVQLQTHLLAVPMPSCWLKAVRRA